MFTFINYSIVLFCAHVTLSPLSSPGYERQTHVCLWVCYVYNWVYVRVTLCCWRCRVEEGPSCVQTKESGSPGVQRRGSARQEAPLSRSSPMRGHRPKLCVHASLEATEHAWTRREKTVCPAVNQRHTNKPWNHDFSRKLPCTI